MSAVTRERVIDDIDHVPAIPAAAVEIAATLLRWDALAQRFRALAEERLPSLEGQHAELTAAVHGFKDRHQALVAEVAKLEGKRGALLLELNALQAEIRAALHGIRPESAWEITYDRQPKL